MSLDVHHGWRSRGSHRRLLDGKASNGLTCPHYGFCGAMHSVKGEGNEGHIRVTTEEKLVEHRSREFVVKNRNLLRCKLLCRVTGGN